MLTETERATLKHILKFDNDKIEYFESLNLDDEERAFIVFNMALNAFEKGRDKGFELGQKEIKSKRRFLKKMW